MLHLLDFPPELLEQLLLELDPIDVAYASQTCRALYNIVYSPSSDLFWRRLYLRLPLDDPRTCLTPLGAPRPPIAWRSALQRLVRARSVLKDPLLSRTAPDRTEVTQTLLHLAAHTIPLSSPLGDELSLNLAWLAALLRGSHFFDIDDAGVSPDSHSDTAQHLAHLHVLYGLTTHDFHARRRVATRAVVYAFHNYHPRNFFGPFLSDGSGCVNWRFLLCIHHLMSMQIVPRISRQHGSASYTIFPMSMPYTQSILAPGVDLDDIEDWAGIEGKWQCTFNFIDHRDLLCTFILPPISFALLTLHYSIQ
jgi:hypothetical protein